MSNPSQSGWDWPYIVYAGRVLLHYDESDLWNLTPRQFDSQLRVHKELEAAKYGGAPSSSEHPKPTGYIDQIPGW